MLIPIKLVCIADAHTSSKLPPTICTTCFSNSTRRSLGDEERTSSSSLSWQTFASPSLGKNLLFVLCLGWQDRQSDGWWSLVSDVAPGPLACFCWVAQIDRMIIPSALESLNYHATSRNLRRGPTRPLWHESSNRQDKHGKKVLRHKLPVSFCTQSWEKVFVRGLEKFLSAAS